MLSTRPCREARGPGGISLLHGLCVASQGTGASGRRRMGASAAKPAVGARLEIGLDIIEIGKDFRALAKSRYDIASGVGCVRW